MRSARGVGHGGEALSSWALAQACNIAQARTFHRVLTVDYILLLLQVPLCEVLQGCLPYQDCYYDTAACCHAWRVQTLLPAYTTIYDKSLMDCNKRDNTCTFFGAPLHHCQVVTTSMVAGVQIAACNARMHSWPCNNAQQMLTCVLHTVNQCRQPEPLPDHSDRLDGCFAPFTPGRFWTHSPPCSKLVFRPHS